MSTAATVTLPEFGVDGVRPELAVSEYHRRFDETVDRMKREGLDALVVYGDREHVANLAYLTGFDPRFEEALLLLNARGERRLLVGNECMGYLPSPALHCEPELFQEFSLMGQQRDGSRALGDILSSFGIGRDVDVGCVGWKYFDRRLVGRANALDLPSYIVDLLRDLTGDSTRVRNATAMFMNPQDGLRIANSVDQIARFEFAAVRASESIKSLLNTLREGVTEEQLERCYHGGGLPRSCHPMVSVGTKARRGLSSPSGNRAVRGEPYTAALGIEGALSCRAGMIAEGPADLAADLADFYPAFVSNYFDVVATWYEHVKVGAIAGETVAAVEGVRDPRLFKLAVNPGHYIHIDEWLHSPFTGGSRITLRSGMALQMDIIPVSQGPFCCANAEDGIVLADDELQHEIAREHPAAWKRIRQRRTFMEEVIGIRLDPSVLPLSNIAGWFPPYALKLNTAMVMR